MTQRGTTWRDALKEAKFAFLAYAVPAYIALASGFMDAVGDAVTSGAHLDHKAWVDAVLAIGLGALGAAWKVVQLKYTTTRGVQ